MFEPPPVPPRQSRRQADPEQDPRGIRQAIITLVVLVIVCLLGIRRPHLDGQMNQSARTLDGTRLVLEGVTQGRHHRFTLGNWAQRLIRPLLPERARSWVGGVEAAATGANDNSLVFWTLREPADPLLDTELRVTAVGDTGIENPVGRRIAQVPVGVRGRLEAWELPVYPRRGKQVRLRIYRRTSGTSWAELASFKVNNPAAVAQPPWKPEILPASRAKDGASVSLTDFRVERGLLPPGGGTGPRPQCRADLTVRMAAVPRSRWHLVKAGLQDSAGNHLELRPLVESQPQGMRLFLPGALWPDEPAWKLRVSVARSTGFLPEEMYTFASVDIPEDRGTINISDTGNIGGYEVVLAGLAGAGAPLKSLTLPGQRTPVFHVRLRPQSDGVVITPVEAVIGRTRRVPLSTRPVLARNSQFVYPLPAELKGKAVDLTLAVQRVRIEEFLVSSRGSG